MNGSVDVKKKHRLSLFNLFVEESRPGAGIDELCPD